MANILIPENPKEALEEIIEKAGARFPALVIAGELYSHRKEFVVKVSGDGGAVESSRTYYLEQMGVNGFIAKEISEMARGVLGAINKK